MACRIPPTETPYGMRIFRDPEYQHSTRNTRFESHGNEERIGVIPVNTQGERFFGMTDPRRMHHATSHHYPRRSHGATTQDHSRVRSTSRTTAPERSFGWFGDDRVSREILRGGNNRMPQLYHHNEHHQERDEDREHEEHERREHERQEHESQGWRNNNGPWHTNSRPVTSAWAPWSR